jgi:hypothetical protein
MMESLALASVCGGAVFFMLVFLRALLKEASPRNRSAEIRFMGKRERGRATPVSIEQSDRRLQRVA